MVRKTIITTHNEPKYIVADLLRVELPEMKRLHHPLFVQHMIRFVARQRVLGLWEGGQ